jgi:hypothetical protein
MADHKPIFRTKGGRAQIGYIEKDEAFDLSGRRRCNYNGVTGNLHDLKTDKIVGHVSLAGNFVGASWLADELFGQRSEPAARPSVAGIAEIPRPSASEEGVPATATTTDEGPEDALLERAIRMVRGPLR